MKRPRHVGVALVEPGRVERAEDGEKRQAKSPVHREGTRLQAQKRCSEPSQQNGRSGRKEDRQYVSGQTRATQRHTHVRALEFA